MKFFRTVPLILLLILFGCRSNHAVRDELKEVLVSFENTRIEFPDMLMIKEGKICPSEIYDDTPILVVFFGKDVCSDCAVSHIWDYYELFQWSDLSGAFQVMIIFSPSEEEVDYICDRLQEVAFPFPVYLDYYSEFSSWNKIPEDPRMHCFMVDENHFPVVVGNPLYSKKVKSLYNQFINKLNH